MRLENKKEIVESFINKVKKIGFNSFFDKTEAEFKEEIEKIFLIDEHDKECLLIKGNFCSDCCWTKPKSKEREFISHLLEVTYVWFAIKLTNDEEVFSWLLLDLIRHDGFWFF